MILTIAAFMLFGSALSADSSGSDCILYPSVTENFRVVVPPSANRTADRSAPRTRSVVLADTPGWEREIGKRYHFSVEAIERPPVALPIEGPFTRDQIEQRFGATAPTRATTFWVLALPAAEERVDREVIVRYKAPGYRPGTNESCAVEIRIPLVTIAAKPPSA